MRVVLTQSAGKLQDLENLLRARGYEVERSPLISTQSLISDEVRTRASQLLACNWLLFTSPAGAEAWGKLGLGFAEAKLGAVGQKTARALETLGASVDLLGEPASARGLLEAFLQHPKASAPVGLPRGDRALSLLEDELGKHGFETRACVIYQTIPLSWRVANADVIVLASPSAVEALPQEAAKAAKLVALGPSTGAALEDMGWAYTQAQSPEATAVLKAIEKVIGAST